MSDFLAALFEGAQGYINMRLIGDKARKNIFIEPGQEFAIPQDTNVYLGMFARCTRSGKAQACTTTGALWADFDGVTVDVVRDNRPTRTPRSSPASISLRTVATLTCKCFATCAMVSSSSML